MRPPLTRLCRRLRLFVASLLALFLLCASAPLLHAELPSDVVSRQSASGELTLHYPARFAPAVAKLDARSPGTLRNLKVRLGLAQMPHVDLWLLHRLDDYFLWTGQPVGAPPWAIGLSLTDRQTVLVRHGLGPDRQLVDIEKTFDHELAHVAIDVARQGAPIPRWFNEGFASFHADEWTLERGELVARMGASDKLIPFRTLEATFPSHNEVTSLAYAQSHHFVRYLAERYGEAVFGKILDRVRERESFSVAFTMVTGDDFEYVEQSWRTRLAHGTSALSILADGTLLFFGASLLFLLAWAVRRRRTRQKFDHLDDDLDGWTYDPERYKMPQMAALRP